MINVEICQAVEMLQKSLMLSHIHHLSFVQSKVMTSLRKEAARCLAEQNLYSTEMKILVAVLLAAVATCWRETVPQALAALGLSPSEYNSCLLNNTQVRMMFVFGLLYVLH